MLADGFIQERVIKVGNPETGGQPNYMGVLIGPGPDVELNDGEGTMPTWQFHPIVKGEKGKPAVQQKVVETIICSANLDSACKRAQALKLSTGKPVTLAIAFSHVGKNRQGQPLNMFNIFNRVGEV